MSGSLTLALKIDAALGGAFKGTFSQTEKAVKSLGVVSQDLSNKQKKLGEVMAQAMARPNVAIGALSRRYETLTRNLDQVTRAQDRLTRSSERMSRAQDKQGRLRGEFGSTAMTAGVVAAPALFSIREFMQQDAAATDLKITMMDKFGKVASAFDKLNIEAIKLGNQLPGTTSDFYDLARSLKEQGLSNEKLINGGLRTSGYLNVLLNMDQARGGEFFAKMLEAHGLGEKDFNTGADLVQRARFAFGMKPDEMFESMKYYAPTTNMLNLKGTKNMEKLFAVEGMGAQVGLEGSSFGTNFAMMLTQLAEGPAKLKNAKRGMKSDAADMVRGAGVSFDFWDKKGNFLGMDNMVQQLEKLNKIKAKYGEKGAMVVAKEMFGMEAGRPAMIIAQKGYAGYQQNIELMKQQASLQQRITMKTASLAAAWEAATGTLSNFAATFGGQFAPELNRTFVKMNDFIGGPMTDFITKHKEGIKFTVKLVAGLMGFKLGLLAARIGLGMLLSPLRQGWHLFALINGRIKIFRALSAISSGSKLLNFLSALGLSAKWAGRLAMLSRVLGGGLVGAIKRFGTVIMWLGRALLMNPIGLVITGLAIAGYLIYRNWDKISPVLKKVWNGMKAGYDWCKTKTTDLIQWFANLPSRFVKFGGDIVDGLINGIKAKWQHLKDTVSNLAESISYGFKHPLGINSPSRVFKGYGHNIVQGVAIGVTKNQDVAVDAVNRMAGLTTHAANGTVGGGSHSGSGMHIEFKPNITIQGNASQSDVQNAMQMSLAEFEKMLVRVQAKQARRAYA